MENSTWITHHAAKTLSRLLPGVEEQFREFVTTNPNDWADFVNRLNHHFEKLFGLLHHLYADQYDFYFYLSELLLLLAKSWTNRSRELKNLDQERESNPKWYLSHKMLGGVCYVDLYAKDLDGLLSKLPYFKELGLTYLHLMPLFKMPSTENDGGYAVSSYREVKPEIGTMQQLRQIAKEFRKSGISLVLDLVFNHTADQHDWALKARSGDPDYMEYYYFFENETLPNNYQKTLREIFPDQRPGSFTYSEELERWVWTTFHNYQWDLNYSNPAVFNQMASEILYLANIGIEILRLDAVAFTWKVMGTSCENLPEAHILIQAFNAITRIAAPAMLFKSEAIVHPDEVLKYISLDECQLSYNPLLMAMLWNTLATRDVSMLSLALAEKYQLPTGCSWVNYVRCHDDIGWTFADEDAMRLGINPFDHRQFLNAFYCGRFPGSFARGLPFQENLKTGDMRISGTCASLAGLEKAINEETAFEVDLAIKRIQLIHAVIFTIGGIPLIYLGDEIGTLNDYQFRLDPAKSRDSRWVHRPKINWAAMERRKDPTTIEGKLYTKIKKLIALRKEHEIFGGNASLQIVDTGEKEVLGYVRGNEQTRCLVLANFSEKSKKIEANLLRLYTLTYKLTDLLTGESFQLTDLQLEPFEIKFLLA